MQNSFARRDAIRTQAEQGLALLQNRAGGEKACYANPTRPPPPLQALGLQPFYIHNNMLKTPHSFRIYLASRYQ
jgi:hypothetical protein